MNHHRAIKYIEKQRNLMASMNFQRGGAKTEIPIAINYEGGKIIEHILKNVNCIGYANLQIGMDAPYLGIVADTSVRSMGRTEKTLEGYDEDAHKNDIKKIFDLIKIKYLRDGEVDLVIQIARGKASRETVDQILKPILCELGINSYEFHFGYRASNYANYQDRINVNRKFIFVNYGMIARLTDLDIIKAGTICNPIKTVDIKSCDQADSKFKYSDEPGAPEVIREHSDVLNILNDTELEKFPKIKLYGIDDTMPFITPEEYDFDVFKNLLISNEYSNAEIIELMKKKNPDGALSNVYKEVDGILVKI